MQLVYLVASLSQVMRLLRSLSFFRPAKAILVPGIYFLGFSANCEGVQQYSGCAAYQPRYNLNSSFRSRA